MLHGRVVRPRGQGAYGDGTAPRVLSVDQRSIRGTGAQLVRYGDFLGVVAPNEYAAIQAAAQLKVKWEDPKSGEVKENGKLPLTAEQVGWLQSALHDVVNAPNGTAVEPFQSIAQAVSGKTGTEETGSDAQGTNAWFAAYTPSDAPKMANIVFVEKGSAGSKAAAPVSRRIIDAWYTLYP